MTWAVCATPPASSWAACATPPSSSWSPCNAVLPPPGSQYAVTTPANVMAPGGTMTVTAQLEDGSSNPIALPNVIVTWATTGGGSFSRPTSVTDSNGRATVTFTGSGVIYAVHAVTASDGSGATGTAAPFEESSDGLATIRLLGEPPLAGATGGVLFLIDAISGMASDGAGHLGTLTDLTRFGRATTIPVAPEYSATGWKNLMGPAIRFRHLSGYYCTIAVPAVAQPYSVVSVVYQLYGGADVATYNDNLFNANLPGGISYRIASSDKWSLYAGTPVQSSIGSIASASDAYLRMDIFNGASSAVYRSGTASTGLNAGTNGITAGNAGIGARNDGVDAMECVALAGMFLINRALTSSDRTAILAFYQARYAGILSS